MISKFKFMNTFDCLKQLDQFGIPIALKGFNNQKNFKSKIGGITTFLIYSFYLTYLVYFLVLWRTNQIQPSSVRFSEGKNITTHKFVDETIFEICYWKYMEGIIDPFAEQDIILMPLFMYYIEGVQQPKISLLRNTRKSKYNSTLIQINNLELTNNNNRESDINRLEGFIIITDCDPYYLEVGQSCASGNVYNNSKNKQIIFLFLHMFQHLIQMKYKQRKQLKNNT